MFKMFHSNSAMRSSIRDVGMNLLLVYLHDHTLMSYIGIYVMEARSIVRLIGTLQEILFVLNAVGARFAAV
jgi:hypothetical protein